DDAGDERSVPDVVDVRGAADEAPREHDAADEVGVPPVDPRVDDRHPDGGELRPLRPEVPRPVCLEIPLVGGERLRVGKRERESRRAERDDGRGGKSEPHETWNVADTPGESPRPGAFRSRYVPGGTDANEYRPPASARTVPTVIHAAVAASCVCSSTGD